MILYLVNVGFVRFRPQKHSLVVVFLLSLGDLKELVNSKYHWRESEYVWYY